MERTESLEQVKVECFDKLKTAVFTNFGNNPIDTLDMLFESIWADERVASGDTSMFPLAYSIHPVGKPGEEPDKEKQYIALPFKEGMEQNGTVISDISDFQSDKMIEVFDPPTFE